MNGFSRFAGGRVRSLLQRQPALADVAARFAEPEQLLRRQHDDLGAAFTRVIWSARRGPAKGGVRIVARSDLAALQALAIRILLKCAANDLPHGGAAGEIVFDKAAGGPDKLRDVVTRFVAMDRANLAGNKDILSPDLGFGEAEIRIAVDAARADGGIPVHQINGKPADLGGVPGRKDATGIGAAHVLDLAARAMNLAFSDHSFSIQGFGHAGQGLAAELVARGWRCVAASDSTAALINPRGLDVGALRTLKGRGGRFADWREPGASVAAREDQFAVPADVFVPAYTSDQVTPARAEQLRCRAILEVANGPVADAAEPLLAGRGVVIIPDLVANAGGIIASHLEWRYGATATPLPADAASIHAEVKARMAAAVEIMVAKAHGSGLSLVDAAYALALERLSE